MMYSDEIARDDGVRSRQRVPEQQQPRADGGDSRQQDVTRLVAQAAQSHEDEEVRERGRLQVEGGGLLVLQVEAPDESGQDGDVDHNRKRQEEGVQPAQMGQDQPDENEGSIDGEDERHRLERHGDLKRPRRKEVERRHERDEPCLHPADEDLVLLLL